MKKSRVEALTDGIIAIAATIMVLELKLPSANNWSGLWELRHTFLAYANSFLMIYLVWATHHDLFKNAEVISKRAYLINGLWIFLLTLVPFTSVWVGTAPDASLPELIYPLNLLLWTASLEWLSWQIRKDNPSLAANGSKKIPIKATMFSGYIVCIILTFIKPVLSIYLIGLSTAAMFLLGFFGDKKKKA